MLCIPPLLRPTSAPHPTPCFAVGALNIPQIAREVGSAVQQVVAQESASLRSSLAAGQQQPAAGQAAAAPAAGSDAADEAAALARRLAPAVTSEEGLEA